MVCCAPDNYRGMLDIDEESEFVEPIPIETVDVAVHMEHNGTDYINGGFLPPPGPKFYYHDSSSVNGGSTISTRDYVYAEAVARSAANNNSRMLEFSDHDRAAMISLGEVSFADHSGHSSGHNNSMNSLRRINEAISRGDWISVADQALKLDEQSSVDQNHESAAPNGNTPNRTSRRSRRVGFNVVTEADMDTLSDASSSSSFSTHVRLENDHDESSVAGSTYMTADDGEGEQRSGLSVLQQDLMALRQSYKARRHEMSSGGGDSKSDDGSSDEIEQLFNAIEWSLKKEKSQHQAQLIEKGGSEPSTSTCSETEMLSMAGRENTRLKNLEI